MYAGFLLCGFGYSVLAFSTNIFLLVGAVLILSIGEFVYVPTSQALLATLVYDARRGA